MRCDDVIRELAVPSVGRDEGAPAEHLAQCETCSRRAGVLPRSIGSGMRRVRSTRRRKSGTACGRRSMHNSIVGFRERRGSGRGPIFPRHPADPGRALGWWQPLVWPRRPPFSWR